MENVVNFYFSRHLTWLGLVHEFLLAVVLMSVQFSNFFSGVQICATCNHPLVSLEPGRGLSASLVFRVVGMLIKIRFLNV